MGGNLSETVAYYPMAEEREMNSLDAQALGGSVQGALDNDALLVERFRAGDIGAFETLFRRYQRPIYNFIARMVPPEDALDVTQEAFYLAMRGIATFHPGRRFSTWLFAIAKNRCFDFMRRRKRVRIEEYDEVERPQPDNQTPDPAGSAARDELARAVNRTLMELSPDDRMVLVLRDYQQLSHEEICEIMGLSIPSVKSRIHRARKRFKERFKRHSHLLEGVQEP